MRLPLVRFLLIALLAVMLPVRGVMAGAMLCPPGHHGTAQGLHQAAGSHADTGCDPRAADGGVHPGQHPGHAAGTDTCHLCAACCAVPPLASAVPAMALLPGDGVVAFPALRVPPPDFVSGGQDRPPRRT